MNLRTFLLCIFLMQCFWAQQLKASSCQYCRVPPFISAEVKPNVLIILDNSNSMDEDFYGEAVGSYSPASKSVVAKKALRSFIDKLKNKLRIGLMTYRLGSVSSRHIHNSFYFTSYEVKSYCPSYNKVCSNDTFKSCQNDQDCSGGTCDDPCVKYCQTGNLTYRSICETQCQSQNSLFDVDYFDEIIANYPVGSEQRDRYCSLVYPKTQKMLNPTDVSSYIYYKHAYPFYSSYNLNNAFCYSTAYNPNEGSPYDAYKCYHIKIGTSDNYPDNYFNYWFSSKFLPTDTDYALGYYDFGRRLSWVYIGRAWFANSSPGDGYLHVAVDDLVDVNGNITSTYISLWNKLDPKENDESGYMSCSKSDKNKCDYIIDAGLTPTAGTFQSAIDYFKGANSPIQVRCQQNFIVYVTDGLPSVDESGNKDTADNLMPYVLNKIDALRNLTVNIGGTNYTFDVKTYVLGVGLSEEAKVKLDQMAIHGGTDVSGHAYYADAPEQLVSALDQVFANILKSVSSGTSVSVLAERTKKGANILQAVFYPEKQFGTAANTKTVNWLGYLYNWWLYNSSEVRNIREDKISNKILDICKSDGSVGGDYIINLLLSGNTLKIEAYSSKNDGTKANLEDTYSSLDQTHPVWESGEMLSNSSALFRKIYAFTGNLSPNSPVDLTLFEFKNLSDPTLLGDDNSNNIIDDVGESVKLLTQPVSFSDLKNYIYGLSVSGTRSRLIDATHVWKLGDIVYSTPQIVDYKDFSAVFVGANDGMLHVFRLGKHRYEGLGAYQQVKLCDQMSGICTTSLMGEELWAFIPKHILPYLRFLLDPDYCHMYYVDLTPFVINLDLNHDNNVDKRILIGGMRLGGAVGCKTANCVQPPADTCPDPSLYDPSNNACVGLSSYFALDVTDIQHPKFLWEFTDKDLGFTFSGPAFIHRNGNYYIMFLSGPTSYDGVSDQNLKIFVLKLNSDFTINTVYKLDSNNTTLPAFNNAFGGRLFTEGVDVDGDGNTDAVFFGVTRAGLSSLWRANVVVAKIVNDSDPTLWQFEKIFNTNEPCTALTSKILYLDDCFGMKYIYFGTGRYFYKDDDPGQNINDVEFLYGVKIGPCLDNLAFPCTINAVHNSSNICTDLQTSSKIVAWRIDLEPKQSGYFKERVISDPTVTPYNTVFFTSTEPTSDICGFGGRSRVWGLNCATGAAIFDVSCSPYIVSKVVGTMFLQLSNGNIEQLDVQIDKNHNISPFGGVNSQVTPWMSGVSPESSTPFVLPPDAKHLEILYQVEH